MSFTREDDVLSLDEDPTPPYAEEFIDFINTSPTSYHAVDYFKTALKSEGYVELKERDSWKPQLKPCGKYFVTRNSSSIIAFAIGGNYRPPNGLAVIASHIDALCWKVKPVSKDSKGGFERLAAAPYSGGGASEKWDGSYSTWWDRDLSLGGRVLVKSDGRVKQRLVNLVKPIARIPTLAAHFGAPAQGPFNYETQMVPIIGMTSVEDTEGDNVPGAMGKQHSTRVLKAVAKELGVPVQDIVDFDLELYDTHPAALIGLSSEFISSPRLDDKLCSFAAISGLINATSDSAFLAKSGVVSVVGLFDNEEIGSGLRQGAKGNFLQAVVERIVEADVGSQDTKLPTIEFIGRTIASSFMISADVSHAYNPNFSEVNMEWARPMLNKGIVCECDPNGYTTTTSTSIALLRAIAEKSDSEVQLFQIRNDSRSGSTVGPMLSERLGIPAIDIGIPQMSMHSIRGLTGAKDPWLGTKFLEGFFRYYEELREGIEID